MSGLGPAARLAAPALSVLLVLAGCGGGEADVPGAVKAEDNPPGDIPDNIAFVPYTNPSGGYTFNHPEGWAQVVDGSKVTFSDKLNGAHVEPGPPGAVPSVSVAKSTEVPALAATQDAFELRKVSSVKVKAGSGVLIVYRRNSAPDPTTGRKYRDEVRRYEISAGGRELIVELFGPVGADNGDAYRTMIDSLAFTTPIAAGRTEASPTPTP